MRKHRLEQRQEPEFSTGFPVGVIAFCMPAIIGYLWALGVQVPPPQTSVYLASDR